MEIKTKFNLGDIPFLILNDMFDDKWYVAPKDDDEDEIIEIIIDEFGIHYRTPFRINPEQDCFATKKQAQAECDKRNKEQK